MKSIHDIMTELNHFSSDILSLNPALKNYSKLKDFEEKRQLILPDDYKEFLSYCDGLSLMGVTIYGINGIENLISVYDFEHFETAYPQFDYIVPFSPDGGGNFYCFDTRYHDSIVFWVSNYEYSENDMPEKVNESFRDWMEEVLISWTLESYNYDGSIKK